MKGVFVDAQCIVPYHAISFVQGASEELIKQAHHISTTFQTVYHINSIHQKQGRLSLRLSILDGRRLIKRGSCSSNWEHKYQLGKLLLTKCRKSKPQTSCNAFFILISTTWRQHSGELYPTSIPILHLTSGHNSFKARSQFINSVGTSQYFEKGIKTACLVHMWMHTFKF